MRASARFRHLTPALRLTSALTAGVAVGLLLAALVVPPVS